LLNKTSFLALKEVGINGAKSSNLLKIVKEVMLEWGLCVKNIITLTMDGASNMCGELGGLYALLKIENPHLIYIHCAAHRFNLAMRDVLKNAG
jgi:hypothetical protein